MRTTLKARADAADWRAKFEAFMAAPDDARAWSIQQGLLTASDADMLRFAERHVVLDSELSERLCGSGRQATPACQKSRQAIAVRRAEFDHYIEQARVKREAEQAVQFAARQAQEARDEQERRRLDAMTPRREPDFWDQLAGLAEGFAAAAEAGNQQVTVRTYDSQGTFLGTETMTRARAAGLGAQAPN
jgi:Na+-translocating ferredoxin:NAD+ oxidoreductase RnfC subunit